MFSDFLPPALPLGMHRVTKEVRSEEVLFAWKHLTAHEYTTGRRLPENRQKLYVLSRYAAKQAISDYLRSFCGQSVRLTEIEIFATPKRGPAFRLLNVASNRWQQLYAADLSIAHSHEMVGALVGDKSIFSSVGVDIEKNRTFKPEIISGFLTPLEVKAYNRITSVIDQQAFVTRYWCVKEAYMKARKMGLRLHPQRIAIAELTPNQYVVAEDGKQTSAAVHCWLLTGGYRIATVALKN